MAARFGSRTMTFGTGRPRSRPIERDEAADASRFFSRIAYAVLGLGGPVGVVIHPLALFVIFPIGVALILMSAALEAKGGFSAESCARSGCGHSSSCWPGSCGRRCHSYLHPIPFRRRNTCLSSVC